MPNRDAWSFDYYIPYIKDGARIVLIILFAWVLTVVAQRAIKGLRKYAVRMMSKSGNTTEYEVEKRATTVAGVARKSIVFVIWMVALLMMLQKLGFEIGPLLASLGVVGVAVGFGAQSLVKDILGGVFLLLENQIRVNDVAVINGTGGLVEEINLRTTVLRAENGAVHIFPNGSIQSLSNLTRDYSYYVFELTVDGAADTGKVAAELKQIAENLATEEPYKAIILAPLEIYGIDRFADSGIVIKGRFKTLPGKQWPLGREMNRRIKDGFAEAGIEMPFPTRTIQLKQAVTPELRDELKRAIREVMSERA